MNKTPMIRLLGKNDVDDAAPHVDVIIAHVRIAAQAADDGRQGTKAHAAETNMFQIMTKSWLKYDRCCSPA